MELKKKEKRIGDSIYFAFMAISILRHFLLGTVIKLGWLQNAALVVSLILGAGVVIKILAEWKRDWQIQDILFSVITVGFLTCANFYLQNDHMWEYLLLILGAKNIHPKQIIKNYLVVMVPLFLLVVGASLIGLIDNLIFYRSEASDTVRYAMGFLYVTNFCAHLFYFCVAYAFLRGKHIKYIEILGIAGIGVLCYYLSSGRNSTICIAVLVLVLLIFKLRKDRKMPKVFGTMLTLVMPVLAVVSILLPIFYQPGNPVWETLDRYMGYRISMDAEAFYRFDVTMLGQNFKQTLFGGTSSVGFPENYFFIDCSYVFVLLRMGLLSLIAVLLLWHLITYRACKKENYLGASILGVIALHCFIEHNIFNISYNPFFLLAFAGASLQYPVFDTLALKLKGKFNERVVKNCLSLIIFAVVVELLAFNMQSLTSYFRLSIPREEFDVVVGVSDVGDYGFYQSSEATYLRIEDLKEEVTNLSLNLNLYDRETGQYLYNEPYTYILYGYNEQMKEYEAIEVVNVNTSQPASGYVAFKEPLAYSKLAVGFNFAKQYAFQIERIALNGAKPFAISYWRLLIIYLLLISVYYFGIEKRNAEVTPEAIEVAKATNQFESTGALRTKAHENMQAVYDAKNPFYIFAKRAMDILLSGIAILLLSPVFLATALAIKIEDNGPVFFVQMRAGKNLKPFKMWKFRSMYVNADEKLKEMMKGNEQTGHAFKMKNDPRITKVGKFIRKFSIDELPQLFNVFLGDMSIVGPRPILVFQMEECDDYDKQRLIVQPGLTCIWQVSGRANIKWDKWIELDLDYIDQMSLWTDIKLILKTIPCVLSGDGAY